MTLVKLASPSVAPSAVVGPGRVWVPAPTGIAATDTATLQDAVDDVDVGGEVNIGGDPNGGYVLDGALTISKSLSLKGTGVLTVGEEVTGQGNGPLAAPWLKGSVLIPTVAGQDAVVVSAIGAGVNISNVGVRFADAVAFQDTGHGFVARAPIHAAGAGTGRDTTLLNSRWENLQVWGHDGNHHAYWIANSLNSRLEEVRGFGGGGIHVECDSYRTLSGNMVIDHPYFWMFAGGSAHTYEFAARSDAATTGKLGHITVIRPQSNMDDPRTQYAQYNISAPTIAQKHWHRTTNVLHMTVLHPDLENQDGLSHPVDFGGTDENIVVYAGGAFMEVTNPPRFSTTHVRSWKPPTISAGVAAGTGAAVVLVGTAYDTAGKLRVTSGSSPPAPGNSWVAEMLWTQRSSARSLQLTPANTPAADLNWRVGSIGSDIGHRIFCTSALAADTVYEFEYFAMLED